MSCNPRDVIKESLINAGIVKPIHNEIGHTRYEIKDLDRFETIKKEYLLLLNNVYGIKEVDGLFEKLDFNPLEFYANDVKSKNREKILLLNKKGVKMKRFIFVSNNNALDKLSEELNIESRNRAYREQENLLKKDIEEYDKLSEEDKNNYVFSDNTNPDIKDAIKESMEYFEDVVKDVVDENDLSSLGPIQMTIDFVNSPVTKEESDKKGYISYIQYKKDLLSKIEVSFENFKRINRSNLMSVANKKKIAEFHSTINNLKHEISILSSRDAKTIYNSILEEITSLDDSLTNVDISAIQYKEVTSRLNFLSKLVLGKNLNGEVEYVVDEYVMTGVDIDNFDTEILKKVRDLILKFDNFNKELAIQAFKTNPIIASNKEKFTEEELKKMLNDLFGPGKDINFFQSMFLGIESDTDSPLPKLINDIYFMNIKKSEQEVNKDKTLLEKIYQRLESANFDITKFYKKDKRGIETGKLISKYSSAYLKKLHEFWNLKKDYNKASFGTKKTKYVPIMNWLTKNANVIDIRKLKMFKDLYQDKYGDFFEFSDEEMDDYENQLKKVLGKSYEDEIQKQKELIENFIEYAESQIEKDTDFTQRNIDSENPFLFLKNYYSEDRYKPIESTYKDRLSEVYNLGKYVSFIPKRNTVNEKGETVSTEFYDETFEKDIESNDDAYEAWKIMVKLLDHINSAYAEDGLNVSSLTIPLQKKNLSESIRDAKGSGFWNFLKSMYQKLLSDYKDMFYERFNTSNREGIVSNFSNTYNNEMKTYKKVLKLLTRDKLINKGKEIGLTFTEEESIDEIIDTIARKEIFPQYSKDIFSTILSVSDLAVVQRARKESAFMVETLYNIHSTGHEDRKNSNAKLRNWIDTQIFGKMNEAPDEDNIITRSGRKKFSELDKKIKKVLEDVSTEDERSEARFHLDGFTYFKLKNGKYSKYGEFNGANTELNIDKSEYEQAFRKYTDTLADDLGITPTFTGIMNGMLKVMSIRFLGFNIKSGVKNRIEGWTSNAIRDAEGIYCTSGNIRLATKFMTFSNTIRLSKGKLDFIGKKKINSLQTIDLLVEKLGILQDRKDYRDKKNKVSYYDKYKDAFDVFNFAIGMPEYRNQVELMLGIMGDVTLKDAFGNEHKLFNGTGVVMDKENKVVDTYNYTPCYIPGTLTLKNEFKYTKEAFDKDGNLRTDINLKEYLNKENIAFETFEVDNDNPENNKVHAMSKYITTSINHTQGNFSSLDSQMIMRNVWGRFAMMFKRWLPEHINQRFGKIENLSHSGGVREGRYRVLLRNPAAFAVSTAFAMTLGLNPIVGGIIMSTGFLPFIFKRASAKWFGKEATTSVITNFQVGVGMLQEILVRTLNMPLQVVNSKHQLIDIKLLKDNKMFSEVQTSNALTKEEIGALRACCQELAIGVSITLAIILAKSVFGGGDDDDKDKKQVRNWIDNYGNSILSQLLMYHNPKMIYNNANQMVLFSNLDSFYKWGKVVHQYIYDDKGTMKDVLFETIKTQPIIPVFSSVINPTQKGFDFKEEREFNTGQWWDRFNISEETASKKKLTNRKEVIRDSLLEDLTKKYEEVGYKSAEAEDVAKKEINKMFKEEKANKQKGEGYEDALKRIDFNELENNMEERVKVFEPEQEQEEEQLESE